MNEYLLRYVLEKFFNFVRIIRLINFIQILLTAN